ncbi:MAG: iron-containing alcohol dehydrogenase [Proteobacteria bacterium]|nr:iron-containing alcohol dehydrogenase [Pseudomonadota bacterium]MBU1688331.1 iron-containing alcohol dehydrogenase [Pseudomonadota bacterium]
MSQNIFTIQQPTRLVFGSGTIKSLGDLVHETGGSKVFLVVDPGLKGAGLLDRIVAPLEQGGIPYVIYDKVDPEPGLRLADQAKKVAAKEKCDCVVGVGGGSAMDVAKAVSILLTNGGKAEDYLGLGKIKKPGVPKIMVPTTAGTGAEVSFTAVFINEKTGSKGGMNGDPLYPEAALLDPELTVSMPPHVTAMTGIDALTHALESFVSIQANPISQMYGLEAMEIIFHALPKAYANGKNLEARTEMLLGSLLAGKALAIAGVGLVHAMAYPMGGMFGVPHGLANAVLLPYVVDYNLMGCPEKFAVIAEVMGYNTSELTVREAAAMVVEGIVNLNHDVGIPSSLEELGIPADRFEEMAEVALTVTRPVENNPRCPTKDEVVQIYQNALLGWE